MTRKKAIDLLDNLIGFIEDSQGSDYDEAFKLAIKALKQEPCEDCISRQAVDTLVDELSRAICDERGCISRGRSTATIMQDILDLPPVTLQTKTGHWKVVCRYGYEDNAYICECSECKDTVWVYKDADRKWNYCPNCGAKMEEEV